MTVFALLLVAMLVAVTSAQYNATTPQNVGSQGPYCYYDFDDCLDACPTPSSGATCDNEISGVNGSSIYF